MTPQTLTSLFAERWPADPAATVFLDLPGGPSITYADAEVGAARIANALTTLGVRPGDRVAVQAGKSPAVLLLYLACVRAGAVLLPMNPAYTDDEVGYLVADAEPRLLVQDPGSAPRTDVAAVVTLDDHGGGSLTALAAEQSDHHDAVPTAPDDLAAILYTSGTTGRPKGAMLTQRNLASNALALHRVWGFRPDDVLLHALPVFHTHGLFVATNCALANGSPMIFLPRFDPAVVLAQLPRATVFMGVPTFYTRLLAEPGLDADRCRHVRLFVSGSAPLLATTHDEFRLRTGHRILERYGMTETSMITSNPLDGDRRPGTVGFPLPEVDVRATSPETGAEVAAGEVGDIEVRGPNVFAGYWRQPERSAAEMTTDGFFRTGDVGMVDDDGYLHLVGRSKDLIISGGLNVYPKEVEAVLDELDGIVESAVIGVPDPDFGEAVVAVVVAAPDVELDAAEVRRQVRARLAAFKVPKRIVVVADLPRNAMGKVEKAKLRAAHGA
jgi:malonyl-CoA/methylmalonyl-CoA synthetase